jgi:hypothetical protein
MESQMLLLHVYKSTKFLLDEIISSPFSKRLITLRHRHIIQT